MVVNPTGMLDTSVRRPSGGAHVALLLRQELADLAPQGQHFTKRCTAANEPLELASAELSFALGLRPASHCGLATCRGHDSQAREAVAVLVCLEIDALEARSREAALELTLLAFRHLVTRSSLLAVIVQVVGHCILLVFSNHLRLVTTCQHLLDEGGSYKSDFDAVVICFW